MNITRYKPLFSVTASYELASLGVISDGVTIGIAAETEGKMRDFKLKPKIANNTVTVFYEGTEKPVNAPATSEPVLEINTDQYFYFGIGFAQKERLKGLKLHSTNATAKEIGLPILYDALVQVANGPVVITAREDVKVMQPVFTFTAIAADTGISADYASLEIRDENNTLVQLNIPPQQINNKEIDGVQAVPEFAFSVDVSKIQSGVYEFKVGNYKKKYFVANNAGISGAVALVRVLKNSFLEYKKNLADKTFTRVELMIPKA